MDGVSEQEHIRFNLLSDNAAMNKIDTFFSAVLLSFRFSVQQWETIIGRPTMGDKFRKLLPGSMDQSKYGIRA